MKLKEVIVSSILVSWVGAKNVDDFSKYKLPKGVVQFDYEGHRSSSHPNPRYAVKYGDRLKKRATDGTVDLTLNNEEYAYYSTEIELGTPSQKLKLLIDTGSSDLWVISSDNPYCTDDPKKYLTNPSYVECTDGTFNYEKSDSFNKNDTDFSIQYVDTTGATGFWGTDNVKIGDVTLKDCSVGIGTKANTSQGILGIGFSAVESTNRGINGFQYLNVPLLLKAQGDIETLSYSLWLNDPGAKTGSILFGGVDKAKYSGDLVKVPMAQTISGINRPVEMAVYLSDISVKSGDNKSPVYQTNIPALLDSGTTLTYLPTSAIREIGQGLGAIYMAELQTYVMSCDVPDSVSVEYNFNGAVIDVKVSEMMLPLTDMRGNPAKFDDGTTACALAMSPAEDQIILGDSFLRSAYVVYDLENYEIALAQAKFNVTDSDVEVLSSGIPNAKSASNYDNTRPAQRATVHSVSFDLDFATGSVPTNDLETGITHLPPMATGASGAASGRSSGSSSQSSSTGKSSDAGSSMAAPMALCVMVSVALIALV